MIPDDWMPHRREDGETVGYIRVVDGGFQPMDLLGRPMAEPAEWLEVETALDDVSIAWLDGAWDVVLDDGRTVRARMAEVSAARVVLVEDRLGSIDGTAPVRYEVDVPVADGILTPAAPLTEWPPPPAAGSGQRSGPPRARQASQPQPTRRAQQLPSQSAELPTQRLPSQPSA